MSPPFRSASAVAQPDDWERHKQSIAHLYLEENKPLKEVAAIMLEKHNFKATPKMYKYRFQVWGFRKNLSASEIRLLEAKSIAGKKSELPVVNGRKLGSKRLKSRVNRANTQSSQPAHANNNRAVLMPIPKVISAPDSFRLAENVFHAVLSYSKMQSNSWDFTIYDEGGNATSTWMTLTHLAVYRISERENLAANFKILNKTCEDFRSVMQRQEPLLVWATYYTILHLLNIGSDLAASFVKLAAGFSSVYFGKSHPFTVLWPNLLRMSASDVRQLSMPLMDAQFALMNSETPSGKLFISKYTVDRAKKLHDLQILSPEATHSKMDTVIQSLRPNIGSGLDIPTIRARVVVIYILKACIYIDAQEYSKVEAILEEIEPWVKENGILVNFLEIKAIVLSETGRCESAEYYYKLALAKAQELLRESNPARIGFSFMALQEFYEKTGDTEAAQAVRDDYNKHLKSMVGETSQNEVLGDEAEEVQGT
ncbi:hypothetical protein SCUP515_05200 [Seiridium cupressi]